MTNEQRTIDERDEAIALANRVLDKPYIDPDGDICILARQFLREIERNAPKASDDRKDAYDAWLDGEAHGRE